MSWSSEAFAWGWRAIGLIAHIAHDLGMHPETLRRKVRQAEADSGRRQDLLTTQDPKEIRRLGGRTMSCATPRRS